MTTNVATSNPSQVFISWSGPVSQAVAEALQALIKQVIYSARPWISSKDIHAGSRWSSEIQSKLLEARYGVVCVTSENLDSKWMHFESGALSRQVTDNARVCPYLFHGVSVANIEGPLSQFNAVPADESGTALLLKSINETITDPVEQTHLDGMFKMVWPGYASRLAEIASMTPAGPTPKLRTQDDLLTEVLSIVRAINVRTESLKPPSLGGGATSPTSTAPVAGSRIDRLRLSVEKLNDAVKMSNERMHTLAAENETLKEQLNTVQPEQKPLLGT